MLNFGMNGMEAEASRFRASGVLGRSSQLNEIFDFLIKCAGEGRSPKEAEIASVIFGRGSDFDPGQDALVRVHMHRLRSKLTQYYATHGSSEGRLEIPKGEYLLVLQAALAADPPTQEENGLQASRNPGMLSLAAVAIVSGLTLFLLMIWMLTSQTGSAGDSPLLVDLRNADRTVLVIVGDRLVSALPETSAAPGLDQAARRSPSPTSNLMPIGVAAALRSILPALARDNGEEMQLRILPLSQTTPDMMRVANVIYVGHLADLGILTDPVFAGSQLRPDHGATRLLNRSNGRQVAFTDQSRAVVDEPSHDFSYISTFPGPSGNRFVIIAGGGDSGLMQAAEVVSHAADLAKITRQSNGALDFEAVLDVSSLGNLNVGWSVRLASGLDPRAIWTSERGSRQSANISPPTAN